jgi:hypothetical protein
MPQIYSVTDPFYVNKLALGNPVTKNGAYFIKINAKDSPLYFQAPKCVTKQGFITSGKKMFCDFVFGNDEQEFLSWLEALEEQSRNLLYQNREKWFETSLDEHDIENSMTSPYKMYKSGKFYIIRANVPTSLGKCDLKIYNENEEETDPENIQDNTNVLVILEFKGIRCSVRSFQFDIELKQMLIVEPEKMFEKCIIKPKHKNTLKDTLKEPSQEHLPEPSEEPLEEPLKEPLSEEPISLAIPEPEEPEPDTPKTLSEVYQTTEDSLEIMEVDFPLENLVPADIPMKLKNRNDVYYKMYKDAKAKAREAKQLAIMNYLEAKRIKNTYLLKDESDESDESDVDLDIESIENTK